jgi:hypothetical protein
VPYFEETRSSLGAGGESKAIIDKEKEGGGLPLRNHRLGLELRTNDSTEQKRHNL